MPKPRFRAFPEYLVDWRNAIRFLWHVLTVRVKRRRGMVRLTRPLAEDRD